MPDQSNPDLKQLLARFPGTSAQTETAGPLHLFHAPNSICSQKVRAVLAHHAIPHTAHLLNIFAGETYDPAYVRVRMLGCTAAGLPLVDRHLGTTSVAAGGCDACVVPTVVDAATGDVTVDSLRICLDLDAHYAASGLMPDALRAAILAELAVVDDLPNYQHLAVQVVPDGAPRNAFAAGKVARCDALLAEHGSDPVLRAAYEAKKAKEQSAADTLFDGAAMAAARDAVITALAGLETRLAGRSGPWLFGPDVTMADLFWGAELIRADDTGQSPLWADGALPHVAAYYDRLCALPVLRSAILNFPGARLAKPKAGAQT